MTIVAATMFAVNGAVAKIALDGERHRARCAGPSSGRRAASSGSRSASRLSPARLRIGTRRELGRLAFYGIVGFAVVQWLYFVAIDRLPIGIGLLFEFTRPGADRAVGHDSPGTSPCGGASGRRSGS